MFYCSMSVFGQEAASDYNPFVSANLDDNAKVDDSRTVVESSYHRYRISGDQNYTLLSTFVWYVENGEIGTYDPDTDTWTSIATSGQTVELAGQDDANATNYSEVWVRWNDGSAGNFGYIAVYERSATECILDQSINGYKHLILVPPEVWFLVDVRDECSDQTYSITAQFDKLSDISYPYQLTYSYPLPDGTIDQAVMEIELGDLVGDQLTWDLPAVFERDNTVDEEYVISLDEFRDSYGSIGKIAPLGESAGQYPELTITITHLPQTGGMIMN